MDPLTILLCLPDEDILKVHVDLLRRHGLNSRHEREFVLIFIHQPRIMRMLRISHDLRRAFCGGLRAA